MAPVRNHSSASQNQSYLDDEQNSSQLTSKTKPAHPDGPNMSCPPKAAPMRSEAPRSKSRAGDGLDAGYTGKDGSTRVSREAISTLVKGSHEKSKRSAVAKKAPKQSVQEKSLCQKRKATNQVLCKVLGVVAARRAGAAAVPGVSSGVERACEATANWLEENAPGGACRK